MATTTRNRLLACALLISVTLAAYWQAHGLLFIVFDDPGYVTINTRVQAGLSWSSIRWASTAFVAGNWHPVTLLSHMTDCQLFGLNPAGHHVTSLAIHLANVLLLFWVFQIATGLIWRSAFAAALFAVHPMNVESVAWIAERKNVLSTFFFLLTIWAYIWYTRSPNWKRYVTVAVLFVLGLMAKSMLVTLPFVLLLLDYWPLERWTIGSPSPKPRANGNEQAETAGRAGIEAPQRRGIRYLVTEKIPLIVLSVLGCAVTVWAQKDLGALTSVENLGIWNRITNILASYSLYLEKAIWPSELGAFYPYYVRPLWQACLALVVVSAVTALALLTARRLKFLTFGWLWYLGTLVPVIGIIQVGGQSRADRYAYIPLIGIFIMLVWGAGQVSANLPATRRTLLAAGACVIVILTMVTRQQVSYWHDSLSLLEHTKQVTGGHNWMAEFLMGNFYAYAGNFDQAIIEYSEAAEGEPGYNLVHESLGRVLAQRGRLDEAIAHFKMAASAKPDSYEAYLGLGSALASAGRLDEAVRCYSRALELTPVNGAPAYDTIQQNLGMIFVRKGELEQAISHFKLAIAANPNSPDAYNKLGAALVDAGRLDEARTYFSKALELEPNYPSLYANLGNLSEVKGDRNSAARYYGKALELLAASGVAGNTDGARAMAAQINQRMGDLLAKDGKLNDAREHYIEVLRLRPDDKAARQDLDKISRQSSSTRN
jgi:Flp pilus assembly protein TadD